MIDINNIPYDDKKTWDLICSGFSKCIFQCESNLLRHWLKKIKPRNLWEFSIVISLARPGPLMSGYSDEYVQNKESGKIKSFGNTIIDDVFKSTGGVLVYQESLIGLGNKLAWPHLSEKERLIKSDNLRKAVGKKDQSKVVAIGKDFVDGCIHNGVSKEIADNLFDVIKKSGRYLFNLSHAFAYATIGYITAYLKCHYYLETLVTYLSYSKFKKRDKWKEIHDLINESKILGVEVLTPNINSQNIHFTIEKISDNRCVRFGLSHIKYVSQNTLSHINNWPQINTWQDTIKFLFGKTHEKRPNYQMAKALICTGCFADTKISRISLLNTYEFFATLTDREFEWCVSKIDNYTFDQIKDIFNQCANEICNIKRKNVLLSQIQLLQTNEYDHPSWIEKQEIYYLGYAITSTSIDAKTHHYNDKCVECHGEVPLYSTRSIPVILDNIFITKTKNGKNPGQSMAIINVHDSTGRIDKLPIFPEQYISCEEMLIENNTVVVMIKMGKRGWFVENMVQL